MKKKSLGWFRYYVTPDRWNGGGTERAGVFKDVSMLGIFPKIWERSMGDREREWEGEREIRRDWGREREIDRERVRENESEGKKKR